MARQMILLQPTRLRVLRHFVKWHTEHGYSPSEREAAATLKLSCATIRYHVGVLVGAGMLTRGEPKVARTVSPTPRGSRAATR